MSRLTLIHTQQELVAAVAEKTGRHVLLNAVFDSGAPETIRLNLASPNCSCYSSSHGAQTFSLDEIPFQVLSPAVLLSMSELSGWAANFTFAAEAVGEVSWGQIPQNDPRNDVPLPKLQSVIDQLLEADSLLRELPVETDLYRSYLKHPRSLRLLDGEVMSDAGQDLLANFAQATTCYVQVPELRGYCIQESVREGELGPAGEQFREWFQQACGLSGSAADAGLEYVAYSLRPLRLSGSEFRWETQTQDARRLSIDLLCRFRGQPVWTELKMVGDTWTSSALQQILLYGAMVAGGHQASRLQSYYGAEFEQDRPWLAVVVEDRDDQAFLEDFDQTLRFVQLPAAKKAVQEYFAGIILAKITRLEGQWQISEWHAIG
ncbi:hypothetical protein [Rubinisphaera sp. JC750]|uniref:hypothetical protein n=1 Tax=Rubinisphaera sp. JC750 TaxID=2898658 RepID=UPI001F164664|nr:hypothetical protein [Rubinisphaera sp. JC750]